MIKKYRVDTDKGSFIVETEVPDAPYESPRYGPTGPTGLQVASDQAANVLQGIPQAITGIPGILSQGAGALSQALSGQGTGQGMQMLKGMAQPFITAAKGAASLAADEGFPARQFPEGNADNPAWPQAAQGAGAQLGAGLTGVGTTALARALANRIPSMTRAGGNFQTVMGAAQNVPLDLTQADQIAARANELGERGSTLPKVLRDYLGHRDVNPGMTYGVGRDFATNAGALSGSERLAMNPPMERVAGQFAAALKDANRGAAAQVGMGDLYDAAMKEYRQAKTITDAAAIAKKYAVRAGIGAALGGAGTAAGVNIYHRLMR